jgi:Kdo2-lipid IVA lauroyltransferase/acyltransferase
MSKHNKGGVGSWLLARLLFLFSYVPLWIMYGISGIISWLLYRVFNYRLAVVRKNLKNSFPNKSKEELRRIEKDFYRHFSDVMMEVIKLKSIPEKDLKRRCYYTPEGVAMLNQFYQRGQSVMIAMAHTGNWEWAGASFPLYNRHQVLTAYRPLRNKVFDRDTLHMRKRTGNYLATMKNLVREMIAHRRIVMATALIADQTPPPDNAFWVTFLNQDTPFFKGTEVLSQKFKIPVIWGRVIRKRRGYYEIQLDLIIENPNDLDQPGSITVLFAQYLERDIQNQPEAWLWSHRRWKHRRTPQAEL